MNLEDYVWIGGKKKWQKVPVRLIKQWEKNNE
jgi:hypothetical protein